MSASPTNTPKPHDRPARGPKGSIGTDRFGSESAPTSAWNSTVPQRSAGEGDYPYPDAHSTVPTPDAGGGEYPYPAERSMGTFDRDCGDGDYPVPQERSTVEPQSAGAGASGPRREYPADTHKDAYPDQVNDGGTDGGDYRWGVPYSQKMPENSKWGMYGPNDGGYGHSEDVAIRNLHDGTANWATPGFSSRMDPDSQQGDDGIPPSDPVSSMKDDDWGKPVGIEVKGYEVLGQARDRASPDAEVNEAADFDSPGSEGQYPQPENITFDAYPQNYVRKG